LDSFRNEREPTGYPHWRQRVNGWQIRSGLPQFARDFTSPDGRWLFVNIQSPGISFAITGPWMSGAL
jgi:hypothetical protein